MNHIPTSAMEQNKIKGVHNHFKILAMQPQPILNHQNIKEKIPKKIEILFGILFGTNGEQFHKFDYKFLSNDNFITKYGCTHGYINTKIVVIHS